MHDLDLTYPNVLNYFGKHLIPSRTESRAFLAWFIENYFRLDETEAEDCICDGPDDRGIDGVYVDNSLERITVFQSKLIQNPDRTIGDASLREFAGTLVQFRDSENVKEIIKSTKNNELSGLLRDRRVPDLVEKSYETRGVFVTNAPLDDNGRKCLSSLSNIDVFDRSILRSHYISPSSSGPVRDSMYFDVDGYDISIFNVSGVKVVVAPLSATDLIRMQGIQSGELFEWNVRKSLSKTNVNREIEKSIQDVAEHKNFLMYHNGLTILCEEIDLSTRDRISISTYTVVNGCQSLTTLFEQSTRISSELRLLSRIIEIAPDSDLAYKITHHTNNQNAIKARDFQSNSTIQRRLQAEFNSQYGGEFFYRIKRGEHVTAPVVIENEFAGRLLLAFDLGQPWNCHQTYKILDELHSDIFGRPSVNADRIVAVNDLYNVISESITSIKNPLFAQYSLTKYFLLYLIREALGEDPLGKEFLRNPSELINQESGREKLKYCAKRMLNDLIIDLNFYVQDRNEQFDYKRELKSPTPVREIRTHLVSDYLKMVSRGRIQSFSQDWEEY